jgi:hypothetical protein
MRTSASGESVASLRFSPRPEKETNQGSLLFWRPIRTTGWTRSALEIQKVEKWAGFGLY